MIAGRAGRGEGVSPLRVAGILPARGEGVSPLRVAGILPALLLFL